jgi:hypothetical protein
MGTEPLIVSSAISEVDVDSLGTVCAMDKAGAGCCSGSGDAKARKKRIDG